MGTKSRSTPREAWIELWTTSGNTLDEGTVLNGPAIPGQGHLDV